MRSEAYQKYSLKGTFRGRIKKQIEVHKGKYSSPLFLNWEHSFSKTFYYYIFMGARREF